MNRTEIMKINGQKLERHFIKISMIIDKSQHEILGKVKIEFFIFYCFLNSTLILLWLFQQHYCYNVTGQSQESEGSYTPATIKVVHSKLHLFQASMCTLTATHLTLIYVCTYIRLSVPLGCLIKQTGIIIITILNLWETPGIEPVTSGLKSLSQTISSTS